MARGLRSRRGHGVRLPSEAFCRSSGVATGIKNCRIILFRIVVVKKLAVCGFSVPRELISGQGCEKSVRPLRQTLPEVFWRPSGVETGIETCRMHIYIYIYIYNANFGFADVFSVGSFGRPRLRVS